MEYIKVFIAYYLLFLSVDVGREKKIQLFTKDWFIILILIAIASVLFRY